MIEHFVGQFIARQLSQAQLLLAQTLQLIL
jgi:hypothetical protein